MKKQIQNLITIRQNLELSEDDIEDLLANSIELEEPEKTSFKIRIASMKNSYERLREDLENVINMYNNFKDKYPVLEEN